jgi:hypothetical protein
MNQGLPNLSPEQLAAMEHAQLYMMRQGASPAVQNQIGPYEHRAFAREATQDDLSNALPIAAGTLAWPLYKMAFGARSQPSFSEVGQGLLGVGEGIANGVSSRVKGLLSK